MIQGQVVSAAHEEPHKVPLLITLSDGCYAQFPVIILPSISCMLAGVRLAVIDSDFHRGDETSLRDGPLENLLGGRAKYKKKNSRKGKLNEKKFLHAN